MSKRIICRIAALAVAAVFCVAPAMGEGARGAGGSAGQSGKNAGTVEYVEFDHGETKETDVSSDKAGPTVVAKSAAVPYTAILRGMITQNHTFKDYPTELNTEGVFVGPSVSLMIDALDKASSIIAGNMQFGQSLLGASVNNGKLDISGILSVAGFGDTSYATGVYGYADGSGQGSYGFSAEGFQVLTDSALGDAETYGVGLAASGGNSWKTDIKYLWLGADAHDDDADAKAVAFDPRSANNLTADGSAAFTVGKNGGLFDYYANGGEYGDATAYGVLSPAMDSGGKLILDIQNASGKAKAGRKAVVGLISAPGDFAGQLDASIGNVRLKADGGDNARSVVVGITDDAANVGSYGNILIKLLGDVESEASGWLADSVIANIEHENAVLHLGSADNDITLSAKAFSDPESSGLASSFGIRLIGDGAVLTSGAGTRRTNITAESEGGDGTDALADAVHVEGRNIINMAGDLRAIAKGGRAESTSLGIIGETNAAVAGSLKSEAEGNDTSYSMGAYLDASGGAASVMSLRDVHSRASGGSQADAYALYVVGNTGSGSGATVSLNVTGDLAASALADKSGRNTGNANIDGNSNAVGAFLTGDEIGGAFGSAGSPVRLTANAVDFEDGAKANAVALLVEGKNIVDLYGDLLTNVGTYFGISEALGAVKGAEINVHGDINANAYNAPVSLLTPTDSLSQQPAPLPLAYSVGIDSEGSRITAGNVSVSSISSDIGTATGIYGEDGSVISAGNITSHAQGNDLAVALGIMTKSGSHVDVKNIDVSGDGPVTNLYGIVAQHKDTSVKAGDVNVTTGNPDKSGLRGIWATGGSEIIADNVLVSGGTGIMTDNLSKTKVNGTLFADNDFKDGTAVAMRLTGSVPGADAGIDIGGTVIGPGGNLLQLSGGGIPVGDDLLKYLPDYRIGKFFSYDPIEKLISGKVDDRQITADDADRISKKIKIDNSYFMFGWEDGDHYSVHVDMKNLDYYPEYDVYSAAAGENVDFKVDTELGYSCVSVDAGDYAEAVPKENEGWYYVKVPVGGGVYITVKVRKNVYSAIWKYYCYGMDPETRERTLWICTKVDHGKAKLVCVNGFEKVPDDFIEEYCSEEEIDNILSDGYRLEPDLSEKLFADGLEHPIIEVDVFYIGY